jgi:hypothetical protein
VKGLFRNRPALVLQQAGVVAKNAFNPRDARLGYATYWSHCVTSQPAILLRAAFA